jgi:colanic acid biosynthesis glycosyl transferase WcaI
MKILLLNQAFYPDVASTAQHAGDLAVELSKRRHDVTVLCDSRAYDTRSVRYSKHEVWHGIRILRIPSFGFGKKARWRRAADFGSYLVSCILKLALLSRFDVVISMTSPPLISWLGALFIQLKGGYLVLWVMDLNPDEALAAGWLKANSLTTRCLTSLMLHSLHRAKTIVALDRFMARRIERKGIAPDKIVVVPPWSHDHVVRYDAAGRVCFREEHGLQGKFVVMHSGNHSPCHPLTTLLDAARRLADQPDIVFTFVGGGAEFETVRDYAQRHGLKNIVMLPYQPLDHLAASLSSADLHVVVMGDAYVGIVHPCKVYNIRTMSIPYLYIGPSVSHISEMNPRFTARHGEVEVVVRQIKEAAESRFSKLSPPEDAAKHGQDQLVAKLVDTVEAAGIYEAQIKGKLWRSKNEYS